MPGIKPPVAPRFDSSRLVRHRSHLVVFSVTLILVPAVVGVTRIGRIAPATGSRLHGTTTSIQQEPAPSGLRLIWSDRPAAVGPAAEARDAERISRIALATGSRLHGTTTSIQQEPAPSGLRLIWSDRPASVAQVAEIRDAERWKAGVASVRITPERPMWMAGYASRDHVAEGKLTDLWAKALVLEDGDGDRAVLVTMDLIGIDRDLASSLADKLRQRYGLDRHQIALNTSHTHSGPVVARNLRPMHYVVLDPNQRQLVDRYAEGLETALVRLVGSAIREIGPARLRWGSGTATFAVNRRNNKESDVPELRRLEMLQGPVDHDVPVLAVYRPDVETPHAVVFGYACHATVLSFYQWSGDYPGFAQIELERELPGCTAMFWAGCGGDVNPLPRREVELAREYGGRLAAAVRDVLARPLDEVDPHLHAVYREIDLPLGTLPTVEQLEADAMSSDKYVRSRAETLLNDLAQGGELARHYPYPIATWTLGDDVQMIFLGGEVVVDYALRLKAELAGPHTWVAGYSNDVMAYIPSRRVLREGGYEGGGAMVYYGLPAPWSPEVEELIVREARTQAKQVPEPVKQ